MIALRSSVPRVWQAVLSAALDRSGWPTLKPSRAELDLLDSLAVQQWFSEQQPDVVVLAAAKVGGIRANAAYPNDFLLENQYRPM